MGMSVLLQQNTATVYSTRLIYSHQAVTSLIDTEREAVYIFFPKDIYFWLGELLNKDNNQCFYASFIGTEPVPDNTFFFDNNQNYSILLSSKTFYQYTIRMNRPQRPVELNITSWEMVGEKINF